VLDDETCPVGMVLNLMRFFARESCGWCTPCRDGLPWTVKALLAIESGRGRESDIDALAHHARMIKDKHTACVLAPGAMEPLRSALKHYSDDFRRHVRERRCPWR
jgi:NADH-quinone oxidoreductase subunit F